MPVLYTSLQETQKTILRSCFFSIIQDVVKATGIPFDTIIAMHHGVEVNKTDNRTNVSVNAGSNLPATVSQRRVIATITENYDEDSLTSTVVAQEDAHPIFLDPQIEVSVYPVYVKTQVTIDIEYSCGSKTEAQRVRDDIRVKLSQARNILTHEVEYNILIPLDVQEFIADVHDLKNRLFPQPLDAYFLSNSTKRIYQITDMTKESNAQLAIHERQVRIVGVMDFQPEPPPIEHNHETNTYKLTIPYKFTMDVPRGMCMSYPPMVCNQLMPAQYLSFVQERKVKTREEYSRSISSSHSLGALSHFEANRQLSYRVQEKLPLNLPLFDEFPLRVGHGGYVITTTFLTDVNEQDLRGLINLRELGEFYMDEQFLKFLEEGEREYIVQPYQSYYYLGLHQSGIHYDNNILSVDGELNVRATKNLSLVRGVRVALNLCLDPSLVTPQAFKRMKNNKPMCLLYVGELIRSIDNYKTEYTAMNVAEVNLYRFFVDMLQDAVNQEEGDFLVDFFTIFRQNLRMLQTLIDLLRSKYAWLYGQLNKNVDLDALKHASVAAEVSSSTPDGGGGLGFMRTVMQHRINAQAKR